MKKKFEPFNLLKIVVLILCIANVVVLLFLLDRDEHINNKTDAISYNVPEEESDTIENSEETASPVLTLNENLIPDLSEDDLYDLKNVLIKAGALTAEDGLGNDITDQIVWTLSAVEGEAGVFDASFSVENENRRSVGATATVSAELTSPFLLLTDDSIMVEEDSSFSISPYIKIAMDVDGSDITEYVTTDDYVNTGSTGTYNITIYVYSRIVDNMTAKELTVTVR
ncbi:MAG: hypothetical protein U0L06_11810 [Agathobacter sp.]|nr:hypothetical protein [Agathobacter sp.]